MKYLNNLVICSFALFLTNCHKEPIESEIQFSSILEIGNENAENIELITVDSQMVFKGDSSWLIGELKIDLDNDGQHDIDFSSQIYTWDIDEVVEGVDFYHDNERISFYGNFKNDSIFYDSTLLHYPFNRVAYNSYSDYPRDRVHFLKEIQRKRIISVYNNLELINMDTLENPYNDFRPLNRGWLYFSSTGRSWSNDQSYSYHKIGTMPVDDQYLLFEFRTKDGNIWTKKYGWLKFNIPNSHTIEVNKIGITKKSY